MPVPIPGGLQRVHRVDAVTGSNQRLHPRTSVGLDPHNHLVKVRVVGEVVGDQCVQRLDPGHALREPTAHQPFAPLVHNLDVVVVLSPVISDEQHQQRPFARQHPTSTEKTRAT